MSTELLSEIIPSKVRRKILQLFFQSPDSIYFLREIVRLIDEEVNAVKRELDILYSAKILTRERRMNKVFYTLNHGYIFYDEFNRIYAKMSPLARLCIENVHKLGKIRYIALSTKYARKVTIKDDEIYILFVGVVVLPEIDAILDTARRNFGGDINYTAMTEDELKFRKRNNDPFIWKFLKQPKIMLVGQEEDLLK